MTNEYEKNLLGYLTGTYNELDVHMTRATTVATNTITNNLDTYLTTELGTYTIIDTLESETYDTSIIYGTYTKNSKQYGFLLIVDTEYNPINLITQYDSGTDLQHFYKLELDEKNQIYGVDYNNATSQQRLILLNNVFSNGIARLRQSYNLHADLQGMYGFQVAKNPSQAEYVVAGTIFAGNVDQVRLGRFVINVGSTNEWTIYYYGDTLLGAEGNISNVYCVWGDNFDFRMVGYSTHQVIIYKYGGWSEIDQDYIIIVDLYDIGSTWTSTTVHSFTSIVEDLDTIYYGVHATADGQEVLNLYMINNGVQTLIRNNNLSGHTTDTKISYQLKIIKGVLMYFQILPTEYGQVGNYDIKTGIYKTNLTNEVSAPILDFALTNPIYSIKNTYNLYQFNIQDGNSLYYQKELFNQNYYFSDIYSFYDQNSIYDLKPITMSLFENGETIFNRDLYNLVVAGSTATSTIEVPNTMLNSNTIDQELLLGNNYLKIADNNESIETNIYETLHINSINTLSIKDLDTNTMYPIGSARLNNSVNMSQDYQAAQISKIRINYTDSTEKIQTIDKPTNSSYVYTYNIVFYTDKAINNIEIISNDEVTTYLKIEGTFEIGKYYKIVQELTI